jgi:hypothetical protein
MALPEWVRARRVRPSDHGIRRKSSAIISVHVHWSVNDCHSARSATRIEETMYRLYAGTLLAFALATAAPAAAQEEVDNPTPGDTATTTNYPNTDAGELTPGKGFDIIRTARGSLNISAYGLFRYVNQMPGDQTFTDHLGRERVVKARNDLNWHRTMAWLTGFFWTQKFRYNITLWSLPTTQQTLLFGNLRYEFNRSIIMTAGILPNLTARSLQGSWPFWAGSDRSMEEDFFRAGFSSGFSISGEPISRVYYAASVNTNLSQLGVTASNDTRDMAYSGSIVTMPTTGEFGPRGGFGDLEYHRKVATRFGVSAGHAREGRYAADDLPPNETQLKLSDSVSPYETGALAAGVTVQKLDYDELAADAGFKYRGFSFQGEYYVRKLSDFQTDLPLNNQGPIVDQGFMAQAMHMVVPKYVGLYATGGYVWDAFDRKPWELGGGANIYPTTTRSWRLNVHILHVYKCPASSTFGYYTGGQTGTTISLGTDILL